MPVTILPILPNQGQMIAPNWNNQAQLKNITALLGTDNLRFAPVTDRNYTPGIMRRLSTGGVKATGFPIIRILSPWISDGQIKYLQNTLLGGVESGNATYRGHSPLSVGQTDVFTYNAILNLHLEQLPNLQRIRNGYEQFEWEIIVREVL